MTPNVSGGSDPGARGPENDATRFVRWLLEPPARPPSPPMRIVRHALRAVGFVLRALIGDGTGGPMG